MSQTVEDTIVERFKDEYELSDSDAYDESMFVEASEVVTLIHKDSDSLSRSFDLSDIDTNPQSVGIDVLGDDDPTEVYELSGENVTHYVDRTVVDRVCDALDVERQILINDNSIYQDAFPVSIPIEDSEWDIIIAPYVPPQ